MKNKESANDTLADYTEKWTSDLNRQIEQAGANPNCPICNHDQWTLLGGVDEKGGLYGQGVPFFTGLSVAGYTPAATLACKACGFIKQHLFLPIERGENG